MKILKEFFIIIICLFIGTFLTLKIDFPVPATVYGMVVMFIMLNIGLVKVDTVDTASNFLRENLSFFLIPPSVAIINVFDLIKDDIAKIIIIIAISTILTLSVTSSVIKFVQRRMNNEK